MTKAELRAQIANDLSAFNGKVEIIKAQKVKVKNTAACRYRRGVASKTESFNGSEPNPVHSWCNWSGDRLLNIPYFIS